MKKKKTSRTTQLFISLGLVLTSGTFIVHSEFPSIPDFVRGALVGLGLGLMIIGLVKQRKEGAPCMSSADSKDNSPQV